MMIHEEREIDHKNRELSTRIEQFLEMLSEAFRVGSMHELTLGTRGSPSPTIRYFVVELEVRLKNGKKELRYVSVTIDTRDEVILLDDLTRDRLQTPIAFEPGVHQQVRWLFSTQRSFLDEKCYVFNFPQIDCLSQRAERVAGSKP